MTKKLMLIGGALVALTSTAATAHPTVAPGSQANPPRPSTLVQPVASWRYHRDCGWRGGHWVVDLGAGRIVACRPMRPGREWSWHREGDREGWYDRRNHTWHNNAW